MDFVKCSVFTLIVERHRAIEMTTIIIIVLFYWVHTHLWTTSS